MLGEGIKSVKAIVMKAMERTAVTTSRVRMMAKCLKSRLDFTNGGVRVGSRNQNCRTLRSSENSVLFPNTTPSFTTK